MGRGLRVPPTRTQLPGIFPTAGDLQRQQARAGVQGKIDGYAEMYKAQGYDDATAYRMASELFEKDLLTTGGKGSTLANAPMEFDVQHADGTTERVLGWADRRTQQYIDLNGRPFGPDVKVTKAAPYSAFSGDVWSRMALNQLGKHPAELMSNPELALQVDALADTLAGGRANRTTAARADANAERPLSSGERIDKMTAWQAKYNAYSAPLRLMEMHLRNAASAYAELKKGNMTAWEQFRVSTLHVNETGSVVMPSEFARSGQIGSLFDRVEGQIKQWMEGGGALPDGLIDDMMRTAAAQWEAVENYDSNFKSQVDEALKDPSFQGKLRPEQIFGAPRERFDPWTIATPTAPPKPPPTTGSTPPATAPGGTGYHWDAATKQFVR